MLDFLEIEAEDVAPVLGYERSLSVSWLLIPPWVLNSF